MSPSLMNLGAFVHTAVQIMPTTRGAAPRAWNGPGIHGAFRRRHCSASSTGRQRRSARSWRLSSLPGGKFSRPNQCPSSLVRVDGGRYYAADLLVHILVMRPSQILEAVADLDRQSRNPEFITFTVRSTFEEDRVGSNAAAITSYIRNIAGGEVFAVTPDMTDVVVAAAAALDETDLFDRTLAPSITGVVRFDRPIPLVDARGNTLLAHWLSWSPIAFAGTDAFGGDRVVSAIALAPWSDPLTDADSIQRAIEAELGRDGSDAVTRLSGRWLIYGIDVVQDQSPLKGPTHALSDVTSDRIRADGGTPTAHTNVARLVHALWLMLGQTITMTERVQVRPKRRGPRRMNMPQTVTTIRLRRIVSPHSPGEPTDVHWQHRWYVRGHWAWRACGEHYPQAQPYSGGWRVRLWISPFIKGPDGAPFKQSAKVNMLAR